MSPRKTYYSIKGENRFCLFRLVLNTYINLMTPNTRGYFASCAVLFRALGREKEKLEK